MTDIDPAPLHRLLATNDEWATRVNEDDKDFFPKSAKGQTPKVLWLGCADSRVPESVLTASPPGAIFTMRNIANQYHPNDESSISVLTYALLVVGVTHVIVVGHTQCGGAHAALEAAKNGTVAAPSLPADAPLNKWLGDFVKLANELGTGTDTTTLAKENVRRQVKNVQETQIVRYAWAMGKRFRIHGFIYHLENGRLEDLNVSVTPE